MKQSNSDFEEKTQTHLIPSDTAALPKASPWEEFVFTLKLIGVAAVVFGLIGAIEVFKNG